MTERVKDGGPAFPSRGGMLIYAPQEHEKEIREVIERMDRDHAGLTLRDWFAGQALAGVSASHQPYSSPEYCARDCYEMADAMLKARNG